MADEYGGAFYPREVRKNPGGYLTAADIATAIAPAGSEREKVIGQVRHYAKAGYLRAALRETEGRQSYLYMHDQILVAEVLIRMGEHAQFAADASFAVMHALSVWNVDDFDGDKPPAYSPGFHVINQYAIHGARDWALELWTFRRKADGWIRFAARLYARERGEATYLPEDPEFEKRAVFAVDLADALDRISPMRPRAH